jgi:hypothetical protein
MTQQTYTAVIPVFYSLHLLSMLVLCEFLVLHFFSFDLCAALVKFLDVETLLFMCKDIVCPSH